MRYYLKDTDKQVIIYRGETVEICLDQLAGKLNAQWPSKLEAKHTRMGTFQCHDNGRMLHYEIGPSAKEEEVLPMMELAKQLATLTMGEDWEKLPPCDWDNKFRPKSTAQRVKMLLEACIDHIGD